MLLLLCYFSRTHEKAFSPSIRYTDPYKYSQQLPHCPICQFLDFMFPELWAPFEVIGHLLGFPDSSVGKESTCHVGDPGSIPGSERSPGEGIDYPRQCSWASLVAQLVENPPVMRETWVRSLCWEDPLEKGKATHSNILAWRIPWTV